MEEKHACLMLTKICLNRETHTWERERERVQNHSISLGNSSSSVIPHGVSINWHRGLNTKFIKKIQKKYGIKHILHFTLHLQDFLSPCHDVPCVGPYMPGAGLSGLGGSRLEPPVAPEWSVDPRFLDQKEVHGQVLPPTADASGAGTTNEYLPAVYVDPCNNCLLPAPSKTAGVCGFSATKCTSVMRSNV